MTENNTNNLQEPSAQVEVPSTLLLEALQWHIDNDCGEALLDVAIDRTKPPEIKAALAQHSAPLVQSPSAIASSEALMGSAAAIEEAKKLAQQAGSLEALQQAIQAFDGVSIKKTATNMVFSDGNPKAQIMIIGDAPAADDDAQGKAFMGPNGHLLDKILKSIDIERYGEAPEKAAYVTNILNWRPPGNRTPTQAELDISLPFIEKHIELIQPKYIVLCGAVAAKALLRSSDSLSKLRGTFHDYKVGTGTIATMVTYHPDYLLKTPSQKKAVWLDVLSLKARLDTQD